MFNSKRCFPLSPDGANWDDDGLPQTEGDLLDGIFELIGTPKHVDWKFISDKFAVDYLKKFKAREPKDFEKEFPIVDPEGIKLLQSMLKFNPNFRPSAEECLKSPYFNEVRKFSKIKRAKKYIDLPIESKDEISLREIRKEFVSLLNMYTLERSSDVCS